MDSSPDAQHTAAAVVPAPLPRQFWLLLVASGASNLADGVFKVVVPLLAVTLVRDPLLVAGVAVATSLPWLVCSLPVGAFVDRADRRQVMLVANIARSLVAATLATLGAVGLLNIWALYVCGVAIGIAEVFYDTSSQSILPQIVAAAQLPKANGHLYAVEMSLNSFVGPPLGGLLMGLGVLLSLGAPTALWVLAVGGLLCIRGGFRVERETAPKRLISEIAEGLRFLARHRVLRTLAVLTGVGNMANSAAYAVFVLFAVGVGSPLGLTDSQYGLLLGTSAVGSLIGAVFAAPIIERVGRSRSLGVAVLLWAGVVGIPVFTTNVWIIGAVYVIGGCGISVWNVIVVSLRQTIVPPVLLGRLNSAYRLLAWGTIPVGSAIGGVLAKLVGLRPLFAIMAVVVLLPLLLLPEITESRLRAAEAAVES
ncbi:MAG: MFS transporter [Propionibacteriaceae bacterium]|jgi:MFS family permease|nr:MFS transporter [Propionibacteriaceae bacterium]